MYHPSENNYLDENKLDHKIEKIKFLLMIILFLGISKKMQALKHYYFFMEMLEA